MVLHSSHAGLFLAQCYFDTNYILECETHKVKQFTYLRVVITYPT